MLVTGSIRADFSDRNFLKSALEKILQPVRKKDKSKQTTKEKNEAKACRLPKSRSFKS